ncbi:MAG: hypothetical protein U5L10_04510 [Candidatus Moranbacteria bacterium]|nr:hypothetical protein [Candidatus Moranbacteria bacterium]
MCNILANSGFRITDSCPSAFFRALSNLGSFSEKIAIFFSHTNAEGNVYQATFLSLFQEVKELFVLRYLPDHFEDFFEQGRLIKKTKVKYLNSFYFGDIAEITLKVKKWSQQHRTEFGGDGFILEARFQGPRGLHTIIEQWIAFESSVPHMYTYNPITSGDFPYILLVTSPYVDCYGHLSVSKIAELFGATREKLAVGFFSGFVEDVKRAKYSLVTRNANYNYYKPVFRGQKLYIQMRVLGMGRTKASFILQADYTTKDLQNKAKEIINISAEQEIVYVNNKGEVENLPEKLMAMVSFASGQN